MGLADITEAAVLTAIAECDELGQKRFLESYGYKPACSYVLIHQGREYDSKAIAGVAHKHIHGQPLLASEFSGGDKTVGKRLRALGFVVRSSRNPDWVWDELVLACALVAQNNWKAMGAEDPRVIDLSHLLQSLPIHPPEERAPTFRNPNGVGRKTTDIATVHPEYQGKPTNGGRLDREVLRFFLEAPQRMHAAAARLREGALSGGFDGLPSIEDGELDDISAPEGRLLMRKYFARERSPRLRKRKIDQVRRQGGSLTCEACGFNFGQTYGPLGADYIEVHHIVPLHHIGESKTRLHDLVLLCANCHRMIHRAKPWLSTSQLREVIQNHVQPHPSAPSI
ncbi:HNH endonuclease [Lipingzhangella sp. LS1_29]|uniref:HNH endonuclease n=1 Tax=Lipingzhangella rawalii TaxID=2055835 RepID=A0ABU2H8E4_9ACTN|nr:HNH endonuclease [Lipingzhangella rawalii]MDS1271583.1 HNH endonuclease [Lipingzhangella rawalii]